MPTDTQRAPTGEEIEAVGQDVRAAMSRLAVAQIRAARLNASIGTMENVADAESALIIAIAKRVREAAPTHAATIDALGPMPNTPRTLSECIEAERAAEDAYHASRDDDAETEDYALGTMERARAATDEAVKAVEALVKLIRESPMWYQGQFIMLGKAQWEEITRAARALTPEPSVDIVNCVTTGGASDG